MIVGVQSLAEKSILVFSARLKLMTLYSLAAGMLALLHDPLHLAPLQSHLTRFTSDTFFHMLSTSSISLDLHRDAANAYIDYEAPFTGRLIRRRL